MNSAPDQLEPAPAAPSAPPVPPAPTTPAAHRPNLLQTLRRAQVQMAVLSMAALGLVLSLAGLLALRTYAVHNLELVARAMAYTVEAAVVFRDRPAAQEQLTSIAQREALAEARLIDAAGHEMASFSRPDEDDTSALHLLGDQLAALLTPEATVAPVMYQQRPIGTIEVRGNGAVFASFLAAGIAGLLLCLVVVALGMRQWSRRIQRDILAPLQTLSAVTQLARTQGGQAQRVPDSSIAELHQLGVDFNALLAEVESHQARLAQENRSLTHLAHHDSLTGLPNRVLFRRRLARVLQDAESQGAGIGVLYMDNDHFKQINDRHGHAVGDVVLIEVARRVREQVRETDLVARLGGDEFAVLLAPMHQAQDALRIAEKINASVARPLPPPYQHVVPGVSIGIAMYPQHGRSMEELLRAADRAMYAVKRHARGASLVFDSTRDTLEP